MTVTPASASVTTLQAQSQTLAVTITVSGTSGTPTGSVTLSAGSYSSSATTLASGSASINIPAGTLAAGSDTLTASYTPDAASSSTYESGSGTGSVTVNKVTPTVSALPAFTSIATTQSLSVTVNVSGGTGAPTATGSVTLTGASYSSGATTLSGGSATIMIPAGALGLGAVTLTATYTPDSSASSGSGVYNGGTGNAPVTVNLAVPSVTVSPGTSSITIVQQVTVTVTVSGGAGAPTPTGSITLSGGGYSTGQGGVSLSNGSVQITIAAGALATGTDTLTANYSPDAASTSTYTNASGMGTLQVTLITPTVTVTPNPSSITNTQGTSVTVAVNGGGGNPTPTGSVTLTSGTYSSGAVTLSSGSATINIGTGVLAIGSDTLTANYTPNAGSSSTYNSATGTAPVTVTGPPTITSFTANPSTIALGSSSNLTAVFSGGTGVITPGNISVTSGVAVGVTPATTTIYTLTVTPTSGTTVTQTVTVSIQSNVSVNPSSTGIAVTDQILGMNMAVWYDFTANTSAIVNAFQGAGIVALRWPGGSTSDDYHWNGTAANPANGVAPVPSTCAGAYQDSTTNYLDFINDLENASNAPVNGYDIALTADYGTNPACTGGGSPQEAANWVQYAYANGGNVSHVTVGNEVYGNWEEDLHTVPHDPTTYASAVSGSTGYYSLIKNQSSSTLVGVVVDADCTTSNGCTNGWDTTVLANAKNYYDFVEFHYYPQYGNVTSDTFLVQQAAQEFTSNINTIKSELTTAGESNTPIYVGEIGANSSNPGTQGWSITQGLYAGQLLGEAMNDGVSRFTWWIGFGNCLGAGNNSSLLYGWQIWGAYNVFSDGASDTACPGAGPIGTMSPTAQAFNLFSNVAVNGEFVLTPVVTGDTTNVRAYAATHSSGTETALVLFNLNENSGAPVTIALTGHTTASTVSIETYDKAIYDLSGSPTGTPPDPVGTSTWAPPTTTTMGATSLPLTLTLAPWSMNVVIIH